MLWRSQAQAHDQVPPRVPTGSCYTVQFSQRIFAGLWVGYMGHMGDFPRMVHGPLVKVWEATVAKLDIINVGHIIL